MIAMNYFLVHDHTIKIWNITKGILQNSFITHGFVQAVMFNPQDNNIFFVGNTHKKLILFDRRASNKNGIIFENDSMINSIYVYRDGNYVLTGDGFGFLKLWDIRINNNNKITLDTTKSFIFSQSLNPEGEEKYKPISHITISKGYRNDEEGRYLGVNCYDNVLRIFDRSSIICQPQTNSRLVLLHSLTGYKNKNWPIKSSFYMGKNFKLGNKFIGEIDSEDQLRNETIENSFLIATGSADSFAYIFDIGHFNGNIIQKLEGHKDRVYSVDFHSQEATLVTCSADNTIKIWQH
jgi:COMPASS component SWD3